MALTVITTPEINKSKFKDLVLDLIEDFVHGDTAPFKDVKSILEEYLDNAQDLDATQKAGIFSDWLKEAYSDINKQAMGTALDLMKNNASLELEKYGAESGYNLQVAQEEKVRAEIAVLAKEDENKAKEGALLDQKLVNDKVAYMLEMARLKKQYGYGSAALDGALDAAQGTSSDDGALDKQIEGYDFLNMKDILKTMDEKASLMQNAKIPESLEEKKARVELIHAISGLSYGILDGTNPVVTWAYTPGSTPFSGTWASS